MDIPAVFESLDERERQTLDLVLAGHPNKAIGRRLGVSRRSVARIKSSILAKTDFLSFIELSGALGTAKAAAGRESCKRSDGSGCPARPAPAAGASTAVPQDPSAINEARWQWLCCDLHDGAAQYVSAALLRLQAIEARHDMPVEARPHLLMAGALLDVALRDIRDIIAGRSPACSMQAGIISSIRRLVQELAGSSGIEIEFVESLGREKLSPLLETAVYRILQECLNNATRHSGGDRVRVEIVRNPETLRLEVRDWGCGFDPDAVAIEHRGLRGIRQRAEVLGGRASVKTKPGWGTLVVAELPLGAS
jgi:hypothetical protein